MLCAVYPLSISPFASALTTERCLWCRSIADCISRSPYVRRRSATVAVQSAPQTCFCSALFFTISLYVLFSHLSFVCLLAGGCAYGFTPRPPSLRLIMSSLRFFLGQIYYLKRHVYGTRPNARLSSHHKKYIHWQQLALQADTVAPSHTSSTNQRSVAPDALIFVRENSARMNMPKLAEPK